MTIGTSEKRIVVIAPGDVENEVEVVRGAIDLANSFQLGHRLKDWYWLADSTPGLHARGPQGLTDAQMNIADADLVIAIFWARLGTPVLNAASGTVHELQLAWDSWRRTGKPAVWIYFSRQDVPAEAVKDIDQIIALNRFRSDLPKEQRFSEFDDANDLQGVFANHLAIWLRSNNPPLPYSSPGSPGLLAPPPDSPDTVRREDQLRKLRKALTHKPVACLHGIAGSGKTRLAVQYVWWDQRLKEHPSQALWYDIADGDTLEEMLSVFPGEYVGSEDLSIWNRSKQLLTTLKLRGQLLVLDGFHRANRASFTPLLQLARVQLAPASVLILSRLALLQPDTEEISVRSWTTSEVTALLHLLSGPRLPDSLLTQLTSKTGGLPLAITFFSTLVKQFGRDPRSLLRGELTREDSARDWYGDIKAELTQSELSLLRYFSLAEPYITEPVLRRAEARLERTERSHAFTRLQTLLLVESRGPARWAVHPFVAECTLNDTDKEMVNQLLRDLCNFSRAGIRNVRPSELTHKTLAAGIRACRYAQMANDASQSAAIIRHIYGAAKRLGQYRSLRDLCLWQTVNDPACDPWIKYHYAHCQHILGNHQEAVTLLSSLQQEDHGSSLKFAVARVLADARSQIGDPDTAAAELRKALARQPDDDRGSRATYAQARATLARLLIETNQIAEASALAGELARGTSDDRSLAIIMILLGQIDARSNLRNAEMRFRSATERFRLVNDRRGLAWALCNLAKVLLAQGKDNYPKGRRAAREAMSICSRIGESTSEYREWLETVRPRFYHDVATLSMVDQESSRVDSDMGVSGLAARP